MSQDLLLGDEGRVLVFAGVIVMCTVVMAALLAQLALTILFRDLEPAREPSALFFDIHGLVEVGLVRDGFGFLLQAHLVNILLGDVHGSHPHSLQALADN